MQRRLFGDHTVNEEQLLLFDSKTTAMPEKVQIPSLAAGSTAASVQIGGGTRALPDLSATVTAQTGTGMMPRVRPHISDGKMPTAAQGDNAVW